MSIILNPISQRIFKVTKSRSGKTIITKKLKGIMVAGMIIDNRVGFGYALCHKNDVYDHVNGVRVSGFGKDVAIHRAIKWSENNIIEVPPSIIKESRKFIKRCELYYKGGEIQTINEMTVDYPGKINP